MTVRRVPPVSTQDAVSRTGSPPTPRSAACGDVGVPRWASLGEGGVVVEIHAEDALDLTEAGRRCRTDTGSAWQSRFQALTRAYSWCCASRDSCVVPGPLPCPGMAAYGVQRVARFRVVADDAVRHENLLGSKHEAAASPCDSG